MSRQDVTDAIKAGTLARGITNPLLLAGIANHETNLAHCVEDYYVQKCTQSPGTPSSSSCHGTSVVIGNADATCDDGGMGLFQLDAGKQADTIAKYGAAVLELDGNISAGIDHVLADLASCPDTNGVDPTTWLNDARHGTPTYETWFTCVARYYNGCRTENGCDQVARAAQYRSATESIATEFGLTYWTPQKDMKPSQ